MLNTNHPLLSTLASCALALAPSAVQAQDSDHSTQQPELIIEEIQVYGVRQRLEQAGTLLDTIKKTEVIGESSIEAQHAANLSEAIAESPGVRVSNECSICGVKRIMLNGLKGEHTTILTDGLPVHTMISGYYAVDAVATTGIARIEVARGAGASLTTAEAMGGTVNIVTKEATETGGAIDLSTGQNGFDQLGILTTHISDDERLRLTLIGQFDSRDQFDADNNGVSETPFQENLNLSVRLSYDTSYRDNITLRYSQVFSEILGGPVLGEVAASIDQVLASYAQGPAEQLFVNNDVNQPFIGQPWQTTEWVDTEREEISASWLREINERWNMQVSVSYSTHLQDSFYEGFDYYAEDQLQFYDARFNYNLNDHHLLTFGLDSRCDELSSSSKAGAASSAYIADSFDYQTKGIYLQDHWAPTDWIELAIAVRIDWAEADFTDPQKPGVEIDETIISPRLDGRLFHSDQWTSRISAGRGYRAPLSFFETDHGILDGDAGFAIDVQSLERSETASYALSFEGERLTSTLSLAWTQVEHLAAISETALGVPLLTQSDEKGAVTALDLASGYQISDQLLVNLIVENYAYDDNFKASYVIAPVEKRISLSLDYDMNGWDLYLSAAWIGSRNLNDYAYTGTDVLGSNIAKPTHAPNYWTADLRIAKQISAQTSLYMGANNLFDYTQAGDESSPLLFNGVSQANAGYDVAYIYGPLRGREIYAGIKWHF